MKLAIETMFFVLIILLIFSTFRGHEFWKSVFSDGDQGSLSRVLTALNGIAALAWVSFIVYHKQEIPATDLLTLAAYVTAPYALNKVTNLAATVAGKPSSTEKVSAETSPTSSTVTSTKEVKITPPTGG